jgi:hypothetical protein
MVNVSITKYQTQNGRVHTRGVRIAPFYSKKARNVKNQYVKSLQHKTGMRPLVRIIKNYKKVKVGKHYKTLTLKRAWVVKAMKPDKMMSASVQRSAGLRLKSKGKFSKFKVVKVSGRTLTGSGHKPYVLFGLGGWKKY